MFDLPLTRRSAVKTLGAFGAVATLPGCAADGMVFSRTPQQVLRIVYLTDRAGVSGGGIFPNGMN